MAEALSQSQIDELLNKMRTGGMEEIEQEEAESAARAKEKEYDFSSPKKFTKDQLKSLNSLYENFARVASSYVTSVLRDVCEIGVAQIEEQRYYEYSNSLPDNALVAMISFQPESQQYDETLLMMDMATSFGYFMVDRMLGGSGAPSQPDRDYSEIELVVLEHAFKNITRYLKEAWCNNFPVEMSLQNIETNGRLIQAFSPQDIVVIVTFEIKTADMVAPANICMPAENLEKIINSFSVKYSRTVKQHDKEEEENRRNMMLECLKDTDVTVEAVLEQCQMDVGSIVNLKPNDIVTLNARITDNITLVVEGDPWFEAKFGKLGPRSAVKVINTIEK